jgi:tetratricopeptide (TPR) repeat protein
VSWAKTAADGFLFVMRKIGNIDRCTVEYVRGLREALAQDQSMKRGIDVLLKDVQDELSKPEQDELEILKESVRTAIQECIDTGELDTAVMLINEYEDIVGIDGPLCAAKGIVHIINGEVGKAEDIFLTGIGIEPENPDLLYNLGYLKEISGSKREAFGYYSRAFEVVTDEEFREELVQALGRVSPKSPVHQNGDGGRLMEEQASTLKELLRGKGY